MTQFGARKDVLAFYQELPFNYSTDAAAQADEIRRFDPLQSYAPVAAVLALRPRLLDIGCGTGWLANAAPTDIAALHTASISIRLLSLGPRP
jgi:hypothetical protein